MPLLVGLLVLIVNIATTGLPGTHKNMFIMTIPFAIVSAFGLALPLLRCFPKRPLFDILALMTAYHSTLLLPTLLLTAPARRDLSPIPLYLFIVDFIFGLLLLGTVCEKWHAWVVQVLHCSTFWCAHFIVSFVLMPITYDHADGKTTPVDLTMHDMPIMGCTVLPAVLVFGFLYEWHRSSVGRQLFAIQFTSEHGTKVPHLCENHYLPMGAMKRSDRRYIPAPMNQLGPTRSMRTDSRATFLSDNALHRGGQASRVA